MKTTQPFGGRPACFTALFLALVLALPLSLSGRVLDNFNDDTKTGWKDFTFITGFGLPQESDGQLKFEQPPAGQAIFSASQKISEEFELVEGRTIEFRVDVTEMGGKDSFTVLAFIPTANSPGTLAGYGLARSITDVLITKGINKYFRADAGAAAALPRNANTTMVLSMTARGGSVHITASILDKEDGDKVIWTSTVVDTPGADVLVAGSDSPAAPYITKGYFTLYLYQDFDRGAPENPYKASYDNAEVFVNDTTVLDNFDDGAKSGWGDFTFVPGLGIPSELEGQFRFEMPPAGQAIFSASQKTSRLFELKEGERTEFRVDVIEGGGKDSFAVLAFLPQANSPGTLAGYGLAKSTTDVLITKGINRYFIADAGANVPPDMSNVTLSLGMEVKNGNVIVTARVLDIDDSNRILWERIIVDTPNADVLVAGTDSPIAPFITKGYFTLYLYQDFDRGAPENPYKIYYDNAVVFAPPVAANTPPVITDITPENLANFQTASVDLGFTVEDDQPLDNSKLKIVLDGVSYTTANGLSVTANGSRKNVRIAGKLVANGNYSAVMSATDSNGETTSKTIFFDTFVVESPVIEVEDYNFDGGMFIDNPMLLPEGQGPDASGYSLQTGVKGVDYSDTRGSPNGTNTRYRPQDSVRMLRSLDRQRQKYADAGGAEASIYDYVVGDIVGGEWLQYTRTFASGAYEVYLRESIANMATADSVLELVTGDPTQPDASVETLGTFLGLRTGFEFRNFPLTDGGGQARVRLNLEGVTTLRLRQTTGDLADAARYLNYLVFLRVGDKEVRRAVIASVTPAPDSTVNTVSPEIRVRIQNADTTANPASIRLTVNGQNVAPVIESDGSGVSVRYLMALLPAPGALNSASITFNDNQGQQIGTSWNFTVDYRRLDPANRAAGIPGERGFSVHVVQAPAGQALENSLTRAEEQIKPNSSIPRAVDVTEIVQVINQNKQAGASAGAFPDDAAVPGIDPAATGNGNNDFTVEAVAYLDLRAGAYRFGMITDDGYKLTSGRTLHDATSSPLEFHSGGPANETVEFIVLEPGLYPFRFLWYERGGAAYGEFFSVDRSDGTRILINADAPEAIKAYVDVISAPIVQSSAQAGSGFADDPSIIVDPVAKQVRIQIQDGAKFVKLAWPAGISLKAVRRDGSVLIVDYE